MTYSTEFVDFEKSNNKIILRVFVFFKLILKQSVIMEKNRIAKCEVIF